VTGTALVFGHTSGLGLAVAEALLEAGESVVGIARSTSPVQRELRAEIRADLSQEQEVYRVVREIRDRYADFGILVYSAGTLVAHPIEQIEYATLDYAFRVNLFAPMIIESRLVDLIEANSADVVNITSSSITEYYPLFAEYSASKAALAKFSADLQRTVHDSQARVIDFCPSGFASRMYERMEGVRVPRDESVQMPTQDLARFLLNILRLPKQMEIGHVVINRKKP
jgi:short-subunit dehydrogenase